MGKETTDRAPQSSGVAQCSPVRDAIARAVDPDAFKPSDKESYAIEGWEWTGTEMYHHVAVSRREKAFEAADRLIALSLPSTKLGGAAS